MVKNVARHLTRVFFFFSSEMPLSNTFAGMLWYFLSIKMIDVADIQILKHQVVFLVPVICSPKQRMHFILSTLQLSGHSKRLCKLWSVWLQGICGALRTLSHARILWIFRALKIGIWLYSSFWSPQCLLLYLRLGWELICVYLFNRIFK